MKLASFKKQVAKPLRQATLVFLCKENQVLLAMKKRGFGEGMWNGVGGKLNDGETAEQAAIRETEEEIGVKVKNLNHIATLDFYFPLVPADKNWNQQVMVYFAQTWDGEPAESEEMRPEWFNIGKLPLDEMWPDDRYWLPAALAGYQITAEFAFGDKNSVSEMTVSSIKR